MKNELDDSMVYIGFGEESENHPDLSNKIIFKYVIGFKREDFRKDHYYEFDFEVDTWNGVCYYCDDNLESPTECKINMYFTTWGAKNKIKVETFVENNRTKGEMLRLSKTYLFNGLIYETNFFYYIWHFFLWMIPFNSIMISLVWYNRLDIEFHKSPLATVGFILSGSVMNCYLLFSYVVFLLMEYFTVSQWLYLTPYLIILCNFFVVVILLFIVQYI